MTNFINTPDFTGSSSGGSYGMNTKIMIAAVVVLFMVVVFILLLHIYARWFWRRGRMATARRRRRMRFDFVTSEGIRSAQTGLDQAILSTLPTFVYSKEKMGEDVYDCAVCLSEFEENESGRLIPQCNHRFHTACIDMWFHSHNTCPLCRRSLDHHTDIADPAIILHIESGPRTPGAEFDPNLAIEQQQQHQQQQQHMVSASQSSPNGVQYPPNVLFWGRANEGLSESNSTKQPPPHHLAIDIPRSSSTFSFTSDSPRSPLRSIRRLLSRDKRINHTEPGSPSCNVEDGSVQSDPSSHLPSNPSK